MRKGVRGEGGATKESKTQSWEKIESKREQRALLMHKACGGDGRLFLLLFFLTFFLHF